MLELEKIFEEIDNLYVGKIGYGVGCNLEESIGQPLASSSRAIPSRKE